MEFILKGLFIVGFGYMAMKMMRGGGCCGSGQHRVGDTASKDQESKSGCCK